MSESLSPAALAAVSAAAAAPAPRAVRHFGLAAMEARAQRTRQLAEPPPAAPLAPRPHRAVVRLWLPLTPLFVVLAPFALALALPFYLVPPRLRPDPLL